MPITLQAQKNLKLFTMALAEEKERKKVFGDYKATQFEFSLYSRLSQTLNRKDSINLTKEIFVRLKPQTRIVDYKTNPSVEKEIKKIVYEALGSYMEDKQRLIIIEETVMLVRNRL